MSEKKILEIVTCTCPCGTTVDYENTWRGAINIGDFSWTPSTVPDGLS